MPNQKTPEFFVEPEQVFDAERQAHLDAQKKQAEGMANVAAQNLIAKILAIWLSKKCSASGSFRLI